MVPLLGVMYISGLDGLGGSSRICCILVGPSMLHGERQELHGCLKCASMARCADDATD